MRCPIDFLLEKRCLELGVLLLEVNQRGGILLTLIIVLLKPPQFVPEELLLLLQMYRGLGRFDLQQVLVDEWLANRQEFSLVLAEFPIAGRDFLQELFDPILHVLHVEFGIVLEKPALNDVITGKQRLRRNEHFQLRDIDGIHSLLGLIIITLNLGHGLCNLARLIELSDSVFKAKFIEHRRAALRARRSAHVRRQSNLLAVILIIISVILVASVLMIKQHEILLLQAVLFVIEYLLVFLVDADPARLATPGLACATAATGRLLLRLLPPSLGIRRVKDAGTNGRIKEWLVPY